MASRGGRGSQGRGQGGTTRGGAATQHPHGQRFEAFFFPGSDVNNLNYVPLLQTRAGLCKRCGQLSTGVSCNFCSSDFSEAFRKITNAGKTATSATSAMSLTGGPPAPGTTEKPTMISYGDGNRYTDDGNKAKVPTSNRAAPTGRGAKRSRRPSESDGMIIPPAKRMQQIQMAEAAIELQRDILRRERRRLNEARSLADEVAHFAYSEIDDPACRAPEFVAPYIRMYLTLPEGADQGTFNLDPYKPPADGAWKPDFF